MTRMDRDTVRHLEALARIRLDEAEAETLGAQLERIVHFVAALSEVDTRGVEPTGLLSHDDSEALRPDEPVPGLDRDDVLSLAPRHSGEFFGVPRVIGGGEE